MKCIMHLKIFLDTQEISVIAPVRIKSHSLSLVDPLRPFPLTLALLSCTPLLLDTSSFFCFQLNNLGSHGDHCCSDSEVTFSAHYSVLRAHPLPLHLTTPL